MADQVLSVLRFLSNNLSTFVNEEGKFLGGLRQEIQLITDEFGHMKAFLEVVDFDKGHDPQLVEWTRQVREAAYDTEDVLDEFRLLFAAQRHHGFFGSVRSNFNLLKNLPARYRLAATLQSIKARTNHISEARKRYESQYDKNTAPVSERPGNRAWRYSKDDEALNAREDQLVGIEKPKQSLLSQILDSGSQLKVIVVLGMGGMGKTTLVKRVHSDAAVESLFRIRAWVTLSQTYDLKEFLKVLIRRLHECFKESAPPSMESKDIDDLKAHIRNFLQQGRYAIVIDDVWDRDFWDTFKFALPGNSFGGNCAMLTTRIADVANSCIDLNGDIFRMEYLNFQESMTLFCRKTFRDDRCPAHLEDVVEGIVGKCLGLPLAIVAISGVLATKDLRRKDQWERIQRRLGNESEGAGKLERVKKILSLSFDDLPPTLKTCLLYTSTHPEDYEIGCLYLIQMWISEGFVESGAGQSIEDVGWDYLRELADRSLIQMGERGYHGLQSRFQIHDLLREVILSEARKINLITVITPSITLSPTEKVVRRLVFHSDDSYHNLFAQPSHHYFNHLRSIITFDCIEPPPKEYLSQLLSSKFIKVVDFRFMQLDTIPEQIFNLFLLTHLNLAESRIKVVPKSIKRLQNLEHLDLTETNVKKLPVEILKLQKLRVLWLGKLVDSSDYDMGNYGVKVPSNMGSLIALQWLESIDTAGTRVFTEIRKLTQLRDLGITNLRIEDGKELCSSLEKLVNLQLLRVSSSAQKDEEESILDLNHHISPSSLQSLCSLELKGRLEKMPSWIPSLQNLREILFVGSCLRDDPLEPIQHLPNLMEVHLNQAYEGESLCFKSGGFEKLRELRLRKMKGLRRMRVEEGAMPRIRKLAMEELPLVEEVPPGVEHLMVLEELCLWGMSIELRKKLEEKSGDYTNIERIAHIPDVYIDGEWLDRQQRDQIIYYTFVCTTCVPYTKRHRFE